MKDDPEWVLAFLKDLLEVCRRQKWSKTAASIELAIQVGEEESREIGEGKKARPTRLS